MTPERLTAIRLRANACHRCRCGSSRTHTVTYRGVPTPELLIVGQSPGKLEDKSGLPFVGASGRLLDEVLLTRSLPPWGIINVIECLPPDDGFRQEYADACKSLFHDKITLLTPRWVVALGDDAYRSLSDLAAECPDLFPTPILKVIHPAAILRHRSWRSIWEDGWDDVERTVSGVVQ